MTVSLAVLLKSAREAKKLSIRGLAAESGVHYVTIQRTEAGLSRPTLDTLLKLSKVLALDAALLFHAAA